MILRKNLVDRPNVDFYIEPTKKNKNRNNEEKMKEKKVGLDL